MSDSEVYDFGLGDGDEGNFNLSYEEMGYYSNQGMWELFEQGHVHVQSIYNSKPLAYDPQAVCPTLAHGLINYYANTPKTEDGFNKWQIVVAARQVTKSSTNAICAALKTTMSPDSQGGIIADTQDRADALFAAALTMHAYLPPKFRVPLNEKSAGSTRKLRTAERSLFTTYSERSGNLGIGRSWDFITASEIPFWKDFGGTWSKLQPALINRKEGTVVLESTPAPLSEPSSEVFRDLAVAARDGAAPRFDYLFVPFYQSWTNERTPPSDLHHYLTPEEKDLLARWGRDRFFSDQSMHQGYHPDTLEYLRNHAAADDKQVPWLNLRNIQFLREVSSTDDEIRKDPRLLKIWYPDNDFDCWMYEGKGAIYEQHYEYLSGQDDMINWESQDDGVVKEYLEPRPGAQYAIGVDPKGFNDRGDPASFQVLEVWDDAMIHVAEFETKKIDPMEMAKIICITALRYNDASVMVESNGVGAGVLSWLKAASSPDGVTIGDETYYIKNLYFHDKGKPGIPASKRANDENLSFIIEALVSRTLQTKSRPLISQLQSYKNDKVIALSETAKMLGASKGARRSKHHWDRVSALGWAVRQARLLPRRYRTESTVVPEDVRQMLHAHVGWGELQDEQALKYLRQLHAEARKTRRGKFFG